MQASTYEGTKARLHINVDRAEKAALFAKRFEDRSLAWLCALHLPNGTPLSINHIRRVLKVENRNERRAWLEQAATAGWSAHRLDREIQQSIEPGSASGGPKIKAPTDLSDVLGQVSEWTDAWLKRNGAVWSRDVSARRNHPCAPSGH